MDITIQPHSLRGDLTIIPSKSLAHRYLICAAFADKPTQIVCTQTNRDIEATADCLRALGAEITRTDSGYCIFPCNVPPQKATLNCGESGSTLRFLLPVACALGVETTFILEGRLPDRPLSPLWEELQRMGCTLTRPTKNTILCRGKLQSGEFTIDGGVSSQFITGLLFAASLLPGESTIFVKGRLESKPYLDMTRQAMSDFGIATPNLCICGGTPYQSPARIQVEGDWSNGSFFSAANSMGSDINIAGLNPDSLQGDRAILDLLPQLKTGFTTIPAADIPDLVPILSICAAAGHGAVFTDIRRLRLKESDRVASVIAMVESLGGRAEATENTLTIHGTGLRGGTVDAMNDHRIAMSAAIASTVCADPVTILGAECVSKSYPQFWDEFLRLGGKYEQYIR